MYFASISYVIISIILVLKLELPTLLTGFLNIYTVGLLMKIISYSHVLNNVRYYIHVMNKEKNLEVRDEILNDILKPVN